jgi:hypothetical protein
MAELILLEILALPAERSRGRHNPRVIKRKMSTFPTRARAAPAPAPRQVFQYENHIRIVAPGIAPAVAPAVAPAIAPGRGETDPPAITARPRCPRRRTPRSTGQHTMWHDHVRAWRASNLSRHAYCQVHNLALRSFNAWVARLRHAFRRTRRDSTERP